jgi:hypothetical protein
MWAVAFWFLRKPIVSETLAMENTVHRYANIQAPTGGVISKEKVK